MSRRESRTNSAEARRRKGTPSSARARLMKSPYLSSPTCPTRTRRVARARGGDEEVAVAANLPRRFGGIRVREDASVSAVLSVSGLGMGAGGRSTSTHMLPRATTSRGPA